VPCGVCSWAPVLFVWTFFTFWVFVCLHIVEGVAFLYNGVWTNGNEGMFAIAWTAYIGFATAVAGDAAAAAHSSHAAVQQQRSSSAQHPLEQCSSSAQQPLEQCSSSSHWSRHGPRLELDDCASTLPDRDMTVT
jgi:type IV secretory pathway TrbL component